ncbi:MAG: anti-sigma factor antagonist [Limnochordales bacterium]|nr:MAG: anti-sigma F factor antagonist [Bacillota bacterium]
MLIATRRSQDSLIVRMTGELDLRTAELFRSEVRRAWEAPPRPRHLILDLRGLTFIDSAGVGAILARCRDVSHSTAGRVVAFGTRPHVHRTLAMAGAWRVMHVAATQREALAVAKGEGSA